MRSIPENNEVLFYVLQSKACQNINHNDNFKLIKTDLC